MIEEGMVASACSVGYGGIAEALFKMGLGNRIGFKMRADMTTHQMFEPMYGSIILEMVSDSPAGMLLGETTKEYTFESCGEKLDMAELQEIWESKLEPVYPYRKAGDVYKRQALNWPSARARSVWLGPLPRRMWTSSSPLPPRRTSRLPLWPRSPRKSA